MGQTAARTYQKKSDTKKMLVEKAAKDGLAAKTANNGKMPNTWYPNTLARLKSNPLVAQIPFTASNIEN